MKPVPVTVLMIAALVLGLGIGMVTGNILSDWEKDVRIGQCAQLQEECNSIVQQCNPASQTLYDFNFSLGVI